MSHNCKLALIFTYLGLTYVFEEGELLFRIKSFPTLFLGAGEFS